MAPVDRNGAVSRPCSNVLNSTVHRQECLQAVSFTPSPSSRARRVVKREAAGAATVIPAQPASIGKLAPDSLACSLFLSARIVSAVRNGSSLTQAFGILRDHQAAATRAAAQEISYGTLRSHGLGEFFLSRLLDHPLIDADSESLLLVALYRLRSRPDAAHTVVDQAVTAAGEFAGGAYKKLVNALLRNYLRQRTTLDAACRSDDVACHQHPQWWLQRLRRAYPTEWPHIVAADNSPPPMTLRVNRRRGGVADYAARLAAEGFTSRELGGDALLLDKPVVVDRLPGFADGWVSVQDAGAQLAGKWLQPVAGQCVLDACAAPGGKTAHLLEMADIRLTSLDTDRLRAQRISDNLRRLALSADVRVADCRDSASWWDGAPFDAILADVPCSASGVVRRHPDAKYLRRTSDVRRFAQLQSEILDHLWPLLATGGRLLYATCSLFPEENGAQIDAFLFRHPAARQQRRQQLLPNAEHDGFFYALLEKSA